ncbi:MAG: ribonuclease HII [Melioribacter sp.]|uniref:ribonuclease HII n=1 Tax=Rosettibacter primus TaxID=3111523 RepID=UPI00247C7E17|nr:ribonuclease HII [Melioribacter sp.]
MNFFITFYKNVKLLFEINFVQISMHYNSLKVFDNSFLTKKIKLIAGVDEAGRGPIAGPVVAAAVIFDESVFHPQINDSKKLSEKIRENLYEWIIQNCVSYAVACVNHDEIDEINILQASLKAMKYAVEKLEVKPHLVLIDGNKSFSLNDSVIRTIVKGDSKSFSIAAASILAKVTRDRIMKEAALVYPEYFWERNKGYPTKSHIEAVKNFGITPLHRKSFLKNIIK